MLALEALRECQRGDVDAGVQRYRDALAAPGGHLLEVGLHVSLLASAGHHRAADALREAGMRMGLDLSSCWWARSGNPKVAIREYEQLFASGVGTPCMVEHYADALSIAGESGTLARTLAPDVLLHTRRLPHEVCARLGPIARALRNSTTRQFEEHKRSVRGLDRVAQTHEHDDPDLIALHAAVAEQVRQYAASVRTSRHFIARWLPEQFSLRSWGVISDGTGGYNAPHTHGGCWTVAVAFIEGEAVEHSTADTPGVLRVGAGASGNAACAGWPDAHFVPAPGTVVIMPGFYTHWTTPIRDGSPRVSIAFNVVDAASEDDPNALLAEIGAEQVDRQDSF